MTEALREIALSAAEVQEILAQCGSSALLVGGQALALWAVYFNVEPVGVLSGHRVDGCIRALEFDSLKGYRLLIPAHLCTHVHGVGSILTAELCRDLLAVRLRVAVSGQLPRAMTLQNCA